MKPNTLAKSIAIGNPADGFQVLRSVRSTGGSGAMVNDDEIIAGIQLLAETEGIFTEPAGGVTVAATRKLIEQGAINRDESIVICITGNGYKTADVMNGRGVEPIRIGRSLAEFEAIEQDGGGGCRGVTRELLPSCQRFQGTAPNRRSGAKAIRNSKKLLIS